MKNYYFELPSADSYHHSEIVSLLSVKKDWSKTPEQLIAEGKTNKTIYKYRPFNETAQLIKEPDNASDPRAIKVVVNDVHIGYVPRSELDMVHLLMDRGAISSVEVLISGGAQMKIEDDGDVYKTNHELVCKARLIYDEQKAGIKSEKAKSTKGLKNKWVAFFLCLFLGMIGVHKFYDGKIGQGILYLCTGGLFCIGWLVDIFIILGRPKYYKVN